MFKNIQKLSNNSEFLLEKRFIYEGPPKPGQGPKKTLPPMEGGKLDAATEGAETPAKAKKAAKENVAKTKEKELSYFEKIAAKAAKMANKVRYFISHFRM